jgi:hypothetical protein
VRDRAQPWQRWFLDHGETALTRIVGGDGLSLTRPAGVKRLVKWAAIQTLRGPDRVIRVAVKTDNGSLKPNLLTCSGHGNGLPGFLTIPQDH